MTRTKYGFERHIFATSALKILEITSYVKEKNASMGQKSDLYGVFSSSHFTLPVHFFISDGKKYV